MSKAKAIIENLKTGRGHSFVCRNKTGHKLLTLSYRHNRGFRYFKGSKPSGGGRKHTPCSEARAAEMLQAAIAEATK